MVAAAAAAAAAAAVTATAQRHPTRPVLFAPFSSVIARLVFMRSVKPPKREDNPTHHRSGHSWASRWYIHTHSIQVIAPSVRSLMAADSQLDKSSIQVFVSSLFIHDQKGINSLHQRCCLRIYEEGRHLEASLLTHKCI